MTSGGTEQLTELVHLPGFFEPFSAISHLLGAAMFGGLGVVLLRKGLRKRLSTGYLVSLVVYAVSCVLLFSMSGVYHMLEGGGAGRCVLERLDHGAIFILIAGTFTPIHVILFRGWLRWGPLGLVWGAAIAGITLKTIFFAEFPEWLGLSFYIGLGWFGAVSAGFLIKQHGFSFIRPLLWGGIAYTLGAMADFLCWPVVIPGVAQGHEVFHIAVLAGAGFHWWFIRGIARERPHGLPLLLGEGWGEDGQ